MSPARTQAATLFGIQLYIAEQLGFRKVADTTFMIVGMVPESVEAEDVRKFYAALKRAQQDIDLHHQRYAHFYLARDPPALPRPDRRRRIRAGRADRLRAPIQPRCTTRHMTGWRKRAIFAEDKVGHAPYEDAVLSFA